ncbi:hypothetical protein SB749_07485 [Brevibacterium sp. SIMBA_078]|uniref:hypothetical protein n=1 Tax=Brevibacterium sp. SIMBA_078 TaxID=3085816 RepID=UPI00397C2DBE
MDDQTHFGSSLRCGYYQFMTMRQIHTSTPPTRFKSVEDFLQNRETIRGTVEIELHGVPFHFFYDWRDSDTTLVTFSGTSSAKMQHVPAWIGNSVSAGLGINRILISDPSIILSTELRLAWYAGNYQQPLLQEDIAQFLTKVTASTRPILFGPSGGGFAALLQGAVLPDSTVVASNPQTNIAKFTKAAVDRYMQIAWGQDELDSAWPPFTHEVMPLYARQNEAKVIYIQNAGDADHIEKHYSPFRDEAHSTNHIIYLMPNLGPGHIGPDGQSFTNILRAARDNSDWSALASALKSLEITRNT